jgi:hypothetical protein
MIKLRWQGVKGKNSKKFGLNHILIKKKKTSKVIQYNVLSWSFLLERGCK